MMRKHGFRVLAMAGPVEITSACRTALSPVFAPVWRTAQMLRVARANITRMVPAAAISKPIVATVPQRHGATAESTGAVIGGPASSQSSLILAVGTTALLWSYPTKQPI